jgi:branched-chain amino acid transport system ATP-binding protein
MTVRENLPIGAYPYNGADPESRLASVFVTFARRKERLDQLAGTMSGAEQAMRSIGLVAAPKLLIIDEASPGLLPLFVKQKFSVIRRINESGVSILLVTQNVR